MYPCEDGLFWSSIANPSSFASSSFGLRTPNSSILRASGFFITIVEQLPTVEPYPQDRSYPPVSTVAVTVLSGCNPLVLMTIEEVPAPPSIVPADTVQL